MGEKTHHGHVHMALAGRNAGGKPAPDKRAETNQMDVLCVDVTASRGTPADTSMSGVIGQNYPPLHREHGNKLQTLAVARL